MEFSIIDRFMIALFCGFAYGIVYELLRIIRRLLKFRGIVILCDVTFFVIAAVIVLNLSLYLGNYIRSYTIIGFGAGVFAYIQTLGRLVYALETALIFALDNTIGALLRFVADILRKTIGAFAHKTASQFGKIHDFLAVCRKKSSTLLHFPRTKMYNSKREKITIGESSRGNHVIKAKITRGS